MNKPSKIVLDLGFGDAGKGLVVDNLCSDKSLVIRFSGGSNAGHTVMRNGIKHVFSNFGAGTLKGCPTFFTEDTALYLNAIINEKRILEEKGITPKLYVHPFTKMITPYDVIANRAWERGNQHGSCGMGYSLTMKRSLETPYKLHAIDFMAPEAFLRQKLNAIFAYYRDNNKWFQAECGIHQDIIDEFEHNRTMNLMPFEVVNFTDISYKFNDYVFEGSQGIMLDMDHGIFPNVTYANTTCKNALKYIDSFADIYYVTRCYQTRHGTGWMSNGTHMAHDPMQEYSDIKLINTEEEINVFNQWQSNFRIGEIDYDLLNHALRIDRSYHPDCASGQAVSKNLVVTCLDQRPGFQFNYSKLSDFSQIFENRSPLCDNIQQI